MKSLDQRLREFDGLVRRKVPLRREAGEGEAPIAPSSINEERGEVEYLISTPDVDSYGDTVRPLGMKFDRFRKNPVIPFNHDYSSLPIGRSLWEKPSEDGVRALAKFAREEYDFAASVFKLVKAGILTAVSIGFFPLKYEPIMKEVEDDDGNKEEIPTYGIDIIESELVEYSPVPIPANENALALAAKGIVSVSRTLGMSEPSRHARSGEGSLVRLLKASELLEDYPELLEEDGIKSIVEREIDRVFETRFGVARDESSDARRSLKREEILDELRAVNKALRS